MAIFWCHFLVVDKPVAPSTLHTVYACECMSVTVFVLWSNFRILGNSCCLKIPFVYFQDLEVSRKFLHFVLLNGVLFSEETAEA